jgi:hypothetical protein
MVPGTYRRTPQRWSSSMRSSFISSGRTCGGDQTRTINACARGCAHVSRSGSPAHLDYFVAPPSESTKHIGTVLDDGKWAAHRGDDEVLWHGQAILRARDTITFHKWRCRSAAAITSSRSVTYVDAKALLYA